MFMRSLYTNQVIVNSCMKIVAFVLLSYLLKLNVDFPIVALKISLTL